MKTLQFAILALALMVVVGCAKGDDKAGAPAQKGDYAAEPGQGRPAGQ